MLMMMAVCHTIVPEKTDDEEEPLKYQGSSPDEGALVKGAAAQGFVFHTRQPQRIVVGVVRVYKQPLLYKSTKDRPPLAIFPPFFLVKLVQILLFGAPI